MAGFATVSLQMRGTGCSGGAFDLFGYPSDYDAYDAIEVVAHQPWVAHHKVGMVGISYSGLSQLPAAGTDPPGLAAIAPMSPTDDLFSTGYPGGIYNDGFAAEWIGQRIDDAKPAAVLSNGTLRPLSASPVHNVAQPWTYYEIDAELAASGGASSTCLANQALHAQSEDLEGLVGPQMVAKGAARGRDPSLFDRRSMTEWAHHVTVPVFLSGALQDEQTGPQWPALINAFPKSTPVFANMVNGDHIDSADPQTISRWLEFLDLYVADEVPTPPERHWGARARRVRGAGGVGFLGGAASGRCGSRRHRAVAVAKADFDKDTPHVRVLFDNGAGQTGPGTIGATYAAELLELASGRQPDHAVPGRQAAGSSVSGPPRVTPPSRSIPVCGPARAFRRTAMRGWPTRVGTGPRSRPPTASASPRRPSPRRRRSSVRRRLDLWVKASVPVEDFQATITEVRPQAAQEEYVTSGFLRSTNQVDAPDSTALFTAPTYLPQDARHLVGRTSTSS